MSKIKIVQIAIAASTDDTWCQQYLDDKGRVWEYINPTSDKEGYFTLIELPEEPAKEGEYER